MTFSHLLVLSSPHKMPQLCNRQCELFLHYIQPEKVHFFLRLINTIIIEPGTVGFMARILPRRYAIFETKI